MNRTHARSDRLDVEAEVRDVAVLDLVLLALESQGAAFLGGLEGQLYDLELELVQRSGDWQLIGASWERSLETWDND